MSKPLLQLDWRALTALREGVRQQPLPQWPASRFTVCCWFYATAAHPTQVLVNHGHRTWDEPGWSLYLHEGEIVASLRVSDRAAACSASLPDEARWHHLAVVFARDAVALQAGLDGRQAGWRRSHARLLPGAPPAAAHGLHIGGYTDAAGGHFDFTFGRRGQDRLDDLRVYDRALAPPEVAAFVDPSSQPPVARFTLRADRTDAPTTVRLDASASCAPDGTLLAHWWELGDDQQAEGATVEHRYEFAGRYAIRLTVLDCAHGQASAEQTLALGGAAAPVRVSPVFVNGEAGYAGFRIPSIVAAANGDLVAFAEGRVESVSDSTRTIRIVSKRSRDRGRTWSALQVVGRCLVDGEEFAAMYPAPVVDSLRETGRIVLVYKGLSGSEWEIVRGEATSRTFCVMSDDHGATWRDDREITTQVQRPAWRIQIPTAGHAIQLLGNGVAPQLRGRLFYMGSHTIGADSVFAQWNYAFWSDDLGATWQIGPAIERRADGTSAQGLNEAMAVELSDGRILVNSRNYRQGQPVGLRALTVGAFDGEGKLHYEPTYDHATLIDPAVQGSMERYTRPDGAPRACLLFANPAHASARRNLTVRASFDDGATWPVARVVDPGPSSYSDLVVQDDGDIGVLYERGNAGGIHYASFGYEWLVAPP